MFGGTVDDAGGWEMRMFGDLVADSLIGLVRGAKEIKVDGPVRYLKMDAITTEGLVDQTKLLAIDASEWEINRYTIKPGDLLFNTRNSRELVGKAAVYDGPKGVVHNNNVMRIRTVSNVTSDFLSGYLRSPYGTRELGKRKSGTTSVFAVYAKNLMSLPTPVPPSAMIETFTILSRAVRGKRAIMTTHLAHLETLFAALQSRAFAGEL